MPGRDFVTEAGVSIPHPPEMLTGYNAGVDEVQGADGFLRNWHLAHVLKHIISEFRDE